MSFGPTRNRNSISAAICSSRGLGILVVDLLGYPVHIIINEFRIQADSSVLLSSGLRCWNSEVCAAKSRT